VVNGDDVAELADLIESEVISMLAVR